MAAKQSKNSALNARRARIEEARRQERARDRRNRLLAIIATVVVLTALVAGGGYLVATAEDDDDQGSTEQPVSAPQAGDIEGEQTWSDLGRDHVTGDVDYAMTPPVGGDHARAWMNCDADVYDSEIPEENAVHSLEHGAVWVTYNDAATEADISALSDRVSATPYSLMSPLPSQESPVVLTAWGHQLALETADDPRVEQFFTAYVQGDQTPELGAACGGGLTQ
ncbi:DUF3105 domain-containing protein [Streptomyces litchfieldiae]|uniref:DUF3105 domain-containing protein n=1 Tax=Streptomyces litchfieldiae TaxID=3075543 RepID=A0ABU2MUQ4_9ACTN|nr:DUF3105 domain-containing protein [Streptomyces sp. DSM 44938]MDT0345378.1 DUF3105 domain-containing protein [Streptomyces sp. DSM 44938]